MLETKLFEVRDDGTFIPVLCTLMMPGSTKDEAEVYLLLRAGYGFGTTYVQMTEINGGHGQSTCDPYDWRNRTLHVAHDHIIKNWFDLKSGDVVDVEFILGLTPQPKESEKNAQY